MEHGVIAHRFLEYAVTGRGTCHGHCKKNIREGQLRYGTKVHIQDHDSISWRCMDCVTHLQAENIRNVASDAKQSVHDFLTVPPVETNGPPAHVVDLFVDYLEALHLNREDDIQRLRRELKTHRRENDQQKKPDRKRKEKKEKKDVDGKHLDEQINSDPGLLEMFAVADLRALCKHHGLSSSGTKPALKERLEHHYNVKAPAKKPKKDSN